MFKDIFYFNKKLILDLKLPRTANLSSLIFYFAILFIFIEHKKPFNLKEKHQKDLI